MSLCTPRRIFVRRRRHGLVIGVGVAMLASSAVLGAKALMPVPTRAVDKAALHGLAAGGSARSLAPSPAACRAGDAAEDGCRG